MTPLQLQGCSSHGTTLIFHSNAVDAGLRHAYVNTLSRMRLGSGVLRIRTGHLSSGASL